ncbi:hypothetical protein [Prosthecobacter sp.]|uniref:hypothetical protein n=1 Tax=Prosthecobacter sp. TaxID=1965333 RepID=UPI003783D840
MNLTHWQTTALALAGFAAGLLLHLRWHPLRRHLSDAWDFLRLHPVLIPLTAGALLLAGMSGEAAQAQASAPATLQRLSDWREMILPLARAALAHLAALPHALVPPWPLACVAPVALVFLTIRIWRWPYRYGERRPGPEQKFSLLAVTLAGFAWLGLEAASARHMLPEGTETLKLGLRYAFTALAAAGMQVWLVRFVMAWERPRQTDASGDAAAALEQAFARWQGVAFLAAFNLLWMSWRWWQLSTPQSIGAWWWVELLLVFAALPVAVAAVPGSFWHQGASALHILWRAAIPLLLLAITSLALFILVLYTEEMARAFSVDSPFWRIIQQPLGALVLAMLDCWLLLTALLLMLRLGFSRSTSA